MTRTNSDRFDVGVMPLDGRGETLRVLAGPHHTTYPADHPMAGEARTEWARQVQVYVSEAGRSVRVWVDGQEIPNGWRAENGTDQTRTLIEGLVILGDIQRRLLPIANRLHSEKRRAR